MAVIMQIFAEQALAERPSVVLFDLDNTLYPYPPAHEAALAAMLRHARTHLGIEEATFAEAFREGRARVQERLSGLGASHSRLLYAQAALELLGRPHDVTAAVELEEAYWSAFLARAELSPGVLELLDALAALGITLGLVTDLTAGIQLRKLAHFGLRARFAAITTSEESGRDKPHPASYQLTLQKLRASGFDTRRPWMIGDDPDKDVVGARQAIAAVTLRKVASLADADVRAGSPDAVFDRFEHVRDHVART